MKIKKYIAPNMPEAMKQIRKELGADAVILNSKEMTQGGFFGLFKKKYIEVIAGLDPDPLPKKMENKRNVNPKIDSDEVKKTDNKNSEHEVLHEIQQLKKYVEYQSRNSTTATYPVEYELLYQQLVQQEVNHGLAKKIIESLLEKFKEDKLNEDKLFYELKIIIRDILQESTLLEKNLNQRVIQFVGPTGVGKTTTLAKIASNLILNEDKRVAFITMDTYRIAAVEQLKTYAQILHAPLEVAYTVDDFKRAIQKFESYDLILVDTAGRNFREEKYVNDLLNHLDSNLEMETYLVLSLTAKPYDILEIYDQFHHISMKEVIFTKIDETRQFGSVLNVCVEKQVRVAYMTNGQDVPKDIIKATPERIANLIVGEMKNA